MVQVIRNAVEMQVKHGRTPFESGNHVTPGQTEIISILTLAFIICHEFVCHSRPPCFVALPQSSSLVFKVIEGPSLPLARPHEEVAAICGLEKISCVSEFHVSILMKKVVKPIGLSSYLEC